MIDAVLLLALCGLSFVLKIPYFKLPLDRDYGGHGCLAYYWLKGKGLLYRDYLETKTPGLKIIYMIIIKWLGISRRSFRLFFALYNVITTIAVYACAAHLFGSAAGLIAAGLYALYSSVPSFWWHFSNTESYYVLPTTLSFLCLACGCSTGVFPGILWIFGAGLFGGAAFMFKQPALINTVAPAGLWLLLYAPHGLILDNIIYLIGCGIPVAAFIVYFVIIKKTPWTNTPFGLKILGLTRTYLATPLFKANRNAVESNRRRFRSIMYDGCFLAVLGGAGALFLITDGNAHGLMLVPWIALSFLAAIISRTYLAYHFIPTIPPLCVLGGMVLHRFIERAPHAFISGLAVGDMIAFSAIIMLFLLFVYHLVKDLLMPRELMGLFYSGEDVLYDLCEQIGKYIKSNTAEDDYVYSWGHEPEIYLWSERRAPSFSIFPPICNPAVFDKKHVSDELNQLLINRPKYFVLTSPFGQFTDFEQFIVHNYILEKKFDPYLYLFKAK
jgi:hypothetical protein